MEKELSLCTAVSEQSILARQPCAELCFHKARDFLGLRFKMFEGTGKIC